MTKNTKRILQAIIAGSLIVATGGIIITKDTVKLCDESGYCERISIEQYELLKDHFLQKIEDSQSLTWNEYQFLMMVLDNEAKLGKLKDIKDVTKEDLLPKVLDRVIKQ